jgi:hypothetical protein
MLESILGVRLILWVGNTVPLPAPYGLMKSLTNVTVTNDADQGDGFQMTFGLAKDRTGEFDAVGSGVLDLFNRVVIGVLIGLTPEILIDGIITHHELSPSDEPGHSTFTVTGKDVSVMLDLDEKNDKFENQPDFMIVTRVLLGYPQYGLAPMVTPTTDVPIMLQRIPHQAETDLQFIKRLARKNGFVFYIEPLTFGVNTAYFGVENRLGIPQSALTVGMGFWTNTRNLRFSNDGLAPVTSASSFIEPITKTRVPIPSLPSLRIPPLAASPALARRRVILRDTANDDPSLALTSSVAAVTRAPEAVTGDGEVDTERYGAVLRARKLVGVRGVGRSYDGFYYVRSVTHTISIGAYTQRFSLSREGSGALLPAVIP